jgi:hypothetical protein
MSGNPRGARKCTYPSCPAETERPGADGWTWFEDLRAPGLPDGLYCPAHSAAIEAVINEGGLEDPENDLR